MSPSDAAGTSPAFDQPADCETRPDLILGWFEPQSINLLAGDPYTGKTRLMLCEANRYRGSGKFLGRSDGCTDPVLIGMICRRHDLRNIQKVIKSCQLDHISTAQNFRIVPLKSAHHGVAAIIDAWHDFGKPRPSILFIDIPIQSFAEGNINEASTADAVYSRLREFCNEHSLTILIVAATAKRKMNDGYARSSQAVLGSGSWSMGADVSMFADLPERCIDETSKHRRLLISAHSDETQHRFLEFGSDGSISIVATPPDWEEILMAKLTGYPDELPLRTSQIKRWGTDAHISARNVERWIREMCEAQMLIFLRKGMYQKNPADRRRVDA